MLRAQQEIEFSAQLVEPDLQGQRFGVCCLRDDGEDVREPKGVTRIEAVMPVDHLVEIGDLSGQRTDEHGLQETLMLDRVDEEVKALRLHAVWVVVAPPDSRAGEGNAML